MQQKEDRSRRRKHIIDSRHQIGMPENVARWYHSVVLELCLEFWKSTALPRGTTKVLCGMRDPKALRHGRSCTIWDGESIAEWRSSRYAEDSEIKTSNMSGARIQDLSTSDLRRSQGHPGFSEHNLVFFYQITIHAGTKDRIPDRQTHMPGVGSVPA
ncbi:hypothetical protein CC79DRAFT_1052440 [Sarocladium strictum]